MVDEGPGLFFRRVLKGYSCFGPVVYCGRIPVVLDICGSLDTTLKQCSFAILWVDPFSSVAKSVSKSSGSESFSFLSIWACWHLALSRLWTKDRAL